MLDTVGEQTKNQTKQNSWMQHSTASRSLGLQQKYRSGFLRECDLELVQDPTICCPQRLTCQTVDTINDERHEYVCLLLFPWQLSRLSLNEGGLFGILEFTLSTLNLQVACEVKTSDLLFVLYSNSHMSFAFSIEIKQSVKTSRYAIWKENACT